MVYLVCCLRNSLLPLTPPCLPLRQADPERPLYDEDTKQDMQDCRVAALQQIQETKVGSRSSRSSRVINGGEGAELGVQLAARWC